MHKYHVWLAILVLQVPICLASDQTQPGFKGASNPWGHYPLTQGRWAQLHSNIVNPTDQAHDLLVAVAYKLQPGIQYASRVWVPAHAQRRVIQPIVAPICDEKHPAVSADTITMLLDPASSNEKLLVREPSMVSSQFYHNLIGVIGDFPEDELVLDVVRIDTSSPKSPQPNNNQTFKAPERTAKALHADTAPIYANGWDAFSCVVISQDQPELGAAQIESLRRWLIGGGRVWIMLDQVDPAFAARLLGEDFNCSIVEHIELNRLVIQDVRGTQEIIEHEQPVHMVRVDAPGFDVQQSIDGWPAMLAKHVGRGKVLITTVGTGAWLNEDRLASRSLQVVPYLLLRRSTDPPITQNMLLDYAKSYIGYSVMGRTPVMMTLLGFIALIMVSGIWFARRGKLEYQAIFAASLSVVLAIVLLAFGSAHHGKINSTVASGQWMHIDPNQQYGVLTGNSVIYAGSDLVTNMKSTRGGMILPDSISDDAAQARIIWHDLDRWQWSLPLQHPGVLRGAAINQTVALKKPVTVRISFGENQVTGKLQGGTFLDWSDPVLALRRSHIVPRMTSSDTFVLDSSQSTSRERFITGTVSLTDTQMRRQKIYKRLIYRPYSGSLDRYPLQPTFLAWVNPSSLGLNLAQEAAQHKQLLLSVPIEYVPVQPGSLVHIPAAMIPHLPDRGPEGKMRYLIYDENRDEWEHAKNAGVVFMVRFELPKAVLPLKLKRAMLDVGISAPKRTVELLDPHAVKNIQLAEVSDTQGSALFDLTRWPAFEPDEQGRILVRIRIGKSPTPDMTQKQREQLRQERALIMKQKKKGEYIAPKKLLWSMQGLSLDVVGVVGDSFESRDDES
jgi:hypothetical protein